MVSSNPIEAAIPSRYYFIVASVSAAVYLNILSGGFVYDDSEAIVRNADVTRRAPIWRLLSDDFWGIPLAHSGSHKSYRPLTVLTFRLNHAITGLSPISYHLVNIICHTIASLLLMAITDQILKVPKILKLFCALLFAVHAVHAEAVASIVGRADVLATICVFATLYSFIRYETVLLPLSFALMGLVCKETAIVALPLLAFYCFIKDCRSKHAHICTFLGFTVILSVFRLWIAGFRPPEFSASDNPIAHHPSFLVRLLTFLYLPVFHLLLILFPYQLCFDWSMTAIDVVESPFDLRFLFALSTYAILFMSTFKLLTSLQLPSSVKRSECRCESRSPSPKLDINANIIKRRKRSSNWRRSSAHVAHAHFNETTLQCASTESNGSGELNESAEWLLAVALLTVPHVPASNLLVYVGFVAAERILYLPSAGFCLLITLLIDRFYKRFAKSYERAHVPLSAVCICLLMLHTARLIARNSTWTDEESLYRSAVHINPAKALANLGNVLSRKGSKEEAKIIYQRALAHRPNMADTHYNLGVLYQDANDLERAISSYHTAISYRPTLASAYLNLGLCAWEKNDSETAKEVFEKCLKLDATHLKNPRNHRSAQVACAYNLGVMLGKLQRHSEAITAYKKAIEFIDESYEGSASVLNMLGESLSQIGDFDQAEYYFQKALLHAPSHIPAYLTLSQLRLKQKRYTEALEVLQSAYRLNETNSLLNFHMGVYYSARGDHPEAIKYLKRAEVVNGKNADILSALAESCRQSGLNEEAEKYYERLAEMGDETSPFAYSNYAAILHVNGKYEKAERMYKKAIEINPNDSLSNRNLRKLYRLMNR